MAAEGTPVTSVTSSQDLGMRRFSLSMLLVAICLLPVGIGSGTSAHSHGWAEGREPPAADSSDLIGRG